MIALSIGLAYLCCWLAVTRWLFCRWRPTRVCTWRGSREGYGPHHCKSYDEACHNRIGADGNRLPFKSSIETILAAAATALAWPLVIMMLMLMSKPPPVAEELKARIAELEQEAGIGDG